MTFAAKGIAFPALFQSFNERINCMNNKFKEPKSMTVYYEIAYLITFITMTNNNRVLRAAGMLETKTQISP